MGKRSERGSLTRNLENVESQKGVCGLIKKKRSCFSFIAHVSIDKSCLCQNRQQEVSHCEKGSCISLSVNMFRLLNCISANHVASSLSVSPWVSSVCDGLHLSFDRKQPKVCKFHLFLFPIKKQTEKQEPVSMSRAGVQCQQKQSEVIQMQVAICGDFTLTVLISQILKSSGSRMLHGQHLSPKGP